MLLYESLCVSLFLLNEHHLPEVSLLAAYLGYKVATSSHLDGEVTAGQGVETYMEDTLAIRMRGLPWYLDCWVERELFFL